MRRHSGTQTGENYRRKLNFNMGQNVVDPPTHERTLGDLLDPTRPGTAIDTVNFVTRHTSMDAAQWRLDRLLRMHASLEQAARQQQRQQ